MEPKFITLGPAVFDLIAAALPVRPDNENEESKANEPEPEEPQSVSEWAEKLLSFKASSKQAEVLDTDAKYMILCCNRQWGKTTTIALKSLHRALSVKNHSIVIISRTKIQAAILIERACNFAAMLGHKIVGSPGTELEFAL